MLEQTFLSRAIIFGTGSLILTIVSYSNAWGAHAGMECLACHRPPANETDAIRGDLKHPRNTLCLTCHDASMDVSGLNPPYVFHGQAALAGGSFSSTLRSDKVGHNIHSVDMTLGLTPPGGSAMEEFGCLSCHDSHDNGNYRNLKKEINGNQTLVMANGDPNYRENVYVSGMDNFCGACHEKFHDASNAGGAKGSRGGHPVGITIYGTRHADFESWSRLENRVTETQHPSGSRNDLIGAEVFCLSCHRAHASQFQDAMRWDYNNSAQGCLECHTF
jgi:predicted CXXCH cytochrome family protein